MKHRIRIKEPQALRRRGWRRTAVALAAVIAGAAGFVTEQGKAAPARHGRQGLVPLHEVKVQAPGSASTAC